MFQEDLTKLSEIENALAIFCLATYGEGDPTDNAQEFYDWLQDGAEAINGLRYAVSQTGPGRLGWLLWECGSTLSILAQTSSYTSYKGNQF